MGLSVTIRINSNDIKVFYNERFVTRHDRSYKKHQVISRIEHSEGLLARKPGAASDGWQITAVKSLGPSMKKYLDLLKSGHRSIRNEVTRILALATVYGENETANAASELLERGIVGVENLELALKTSHHPSENELMPAPLNFQKARLNRVVPTVDLRRYDALLFESTASRAGENALSHPQCVDSKQGEETNGTDNHDEHDT